MEHHWPGLPTEGGGLSQNRVSLRKGLQIMLCFVAWVSVEHTVVDTTGHQCGGLEGDQHACAPLSKVRYWVANMLWIYQHSLYPYIITCT